MEASRMAAGTRILGLESSLVKISSSAHSPVSVEDGAFRCSKQKKFCVPVGLSGDGLSGGRSSRSTCRLTFSSGTSSSSSSSSSRPRWNRVSRNAGVPAAAPVRSGTLQRESFLKDIETQDLEAETSSLLQQCSDLDWETLVDDLRSKALYGLQSAGSRAMSLKALEKLMGSWILDQMMNGIDRPGIVGAISTEPGWKYEAASTDLRMEANLQAAQALAEEVDSTFDWETDVAELHHRILLQGDAEPSVLGPEQRLWQAWAHARGQMADTADQLEQEALASTPVNVHGQAEPLEVESQVETLRSLSEPNSNGRAQRKSLFALSAAVATGLAVEGTWLLDAIAGEGPLEVVEAAGRAPSWLVPAVLVFPPLSYFIFNVYRDRVNPYAKLTDWMFGLVALTIVSNIIMMVVWGVKLY